MTFDKLTRRTCRNLFATERNHDIMRRRSSRCELLRYCAPASPGAVKHCVSYRTDIYQLNGSNNKERAQVTLNSIGDGVISTDIAGNVTYLNQVAQAMTGWTGAEALGRAYGDVFRIIDRANPEHTVNPMTVAIILSAP